MESAIYSLRQARPVGADVRQWGMAERHRIVEELAGLGERLADEALELLSRAGRAADADERVSLLREEKVVTRARRSVEKAVTLLSGGPADE